MFCLHHFLPDFVGGTEVYTFNLAKQLQQQGIEPLVVVPNFDEENNKEYQYEGIRVIQYAEASKEDRRMILGKTRPAGLAAFSKLLADERPDVIHFQELAPGRGINIFHVEKACEQQLPVILTFHLSYYTCMKGSLIFRDDTKCDGLIRPGKCTACMYHAKGLAGWKEKVMYGAAMSFFKMGIDPTEWDSSVGTAMGFPYVVNKLKKDLVRLAHIAGKIIVLADWYKNVLLANGVPQQKIVSLPQAIAIEPSMQKSAAKQVVSPLKVVYLGRLSERKGLHLLVDAVCSLPESSVSLSIYGPESEIAFVEENKKKTAFRKNIQWKGKLAADAVQKELSQHHVLCIPSEFEMNPLVIQEAFAAGLPVLASNINGNSEQVQDGVNGWLFASQDRNDLAGKLLMLSANLHLVEEARKKLPEPQSIQFIAEQYAQIYFSAIQCKTFAS